MISMTSLSKRESLQEHRLGQFGKKFLIQGGVAEHFHLLLTGGKVLIGRATSVAEIF